MFTKKDGFGHAMLEPDNSVLPITDVVSETDVEDCVSEVVAVEKEPEGIYHTIALIHNNEWHWSIASSAYDSLAREAALAIS
jgi:hypothetical protein